MFVRHKRGIRVFPNQVVGHIDERIYGHFLEHIFHSVHGGLWGEMLWNRSFEENSVKGLQFFKDRIEVDMERSDHVYLFGDLQWSDYEFSAEAMRISGNEGFLLVFRARSQKEHYWLNVGGWKDSYHAVEKK